MRIVLNTILQNKNILMLTTSLIFMGGILSYFYNAEIITAILISLIAILLIIFNIISPKIIFIWVIIFYAGFFNAFLRIAPTDELLKLAPKEELITGQIVSIPEDSSGDGKKFFFSVEQVGDKRIKAKTLVTINPDKSEFPNLKIGNLYSIKGKLRVPFSATNPSQFAYQNYLRNFNTYTTFYAKSSDCTLIQSQPSLKWLFLQKLNNLRENILKVHSQYLKSPNLEILGGIVFGDDAVNPPEYIKNSFVNSGILHILAASGMNVAFIYGFWYFFMRRLKIPYKISVISGMCIIILYTLMTGLGASVIRAALMLLFILLGKLIDRTAHSISLLAFVAMLMLVYNPAYINNVSFQLSFLTTFGILISGNAIFEAIKDCKIPPTITGAILIPIVAQAWVAPIQMFYFNTFCLYSVIANIAIMPFLSIISFCGFVSSVLAIFYPITQYFCLIIDWIVNIALTILVWISNSISNLPNSLLTTSHPNIIQILIYYSIILGITLMFKYGFKKKMFIALITSLIILTLTIIRIPNHNLEIIAFDVQNADAFLIKTPQNKYFIIDTGKYAYSSKNSQAKIIIIKYLIDRGLKNIKGMIVTHFDNDHAGGAADIINTLNVEKVFINSYKAETATAFNLFNAAKNKDIPYKIPTNGEVIYQEPNLTITTYISGIKGNDNENSIITLLKYNNFEMLFMGDAGIQAFNKISSNIPANIEILKVGHHGANGVVDKEMINKINNTVSIISTGTNIFGHPSKGVIDVLRKTDIYRTDRNHSIKISVDNNQYKIYTFDKEKRKYILQNTYQSKN